VVTLSDKLTILKSEIIRIDTQRIFGSEIPAMKLNYFPDTDSLYIDLSHKPGVESQEVSDGVVLDYDGEGNLVGIDIDHASRKLNLQELVTSHIPLEAEAKA
jgi:uncharacterized protein YuzE